MTTLEWVLSVACVLLLWVGILSTRAAYRNGCRDGFLFSQEPDHPGCRRAKEIVTFVGMLKHLQNKHNP